MNGIKSLKDANTDTTCTIYSNKKSLNSVQQHEVLCFTCIPDNEATFKDIMH